MGAEKLPFNTEKGLSAHFGHLVEWEEQRQNTGDRGQDDRPFFAKATKGGGRKNIQ
jgi:hypothetical protein